MEVRLSPDARLRKLTIGREKAPLMVIDGFVSDADALMQRVPHFDAPTANRLATVHYLFRQDYGGPNMPGPEYINGDTALY
jgi:hypothetical protein